MQYCCPTTPSSGDNIVDDLLVELLAGIQLRNREVRAVQIVIQEVSAGLGCSDPLTPVTRLILTKVENSLEEARRGLARYIGEFEMPEPVANVSGANGGNVPLNEYATDAARTEDRRLSLSSIRCFGAANRVGALGQGAGVGPTCAGRHIA